MIESPSETASSNRLLAMLPRATMQRILPSMVRVGLPLQTRLLASGLAYDAIYFPLDALVVLTHTDEHARTAGIARPPLRWRGLRLSSISTTGLHRR